MSPSQAFDEIMASFISRHHQLPDKPEETAENTVRALWFAAAGQPAAVERVLGQELPALTEVQQHTLDFLIEKRLSGTPLAHLTGRQMFMGVELLAAKQALIPRKETEIVGNAALARIREAVARNSKATVIDVCTGSGNLALAFAHHEPQCTVYAADFSPEAVGVAQTNARHLGLGERVNFRTGDLLTPFDEPAFHGSVDVISCNPPYISTGRVRSLPSEIIQHEPELAFNGGPLGVNIIMKLVSQAAKFLIPGGWLCLEVGEGQGNGVMKLLGKNQAFKYVEAFCDQRSNVRAVTAQLAL